MSNPNGANQFNVDPRQATFIANYLDPKSVTYSNCLQSALRAGYSQEYAENMLSIMPKWLSDSMDVMGSMNRLRKAERNLDEVQNLEITTPEGKTIPEVLRERTKVDMFMAERIGKNIYSTKGEDATDKLADNIKTLIINKQYGSDNQSSTKTDGSV